jgi:hypothetical protein
LITPRHPAAPASAVPIIARLDPARRVIDGLKPWRFSFNMIEKGQVSHNRVTTLSRRMRFTDRITFLIQPRVKLIFFSIFCLMIDHIIFSFTYRNNKNNDFSIINFINKPIPG